MVDKNEAIMKLFKAYLVSKKSKENNIEKNALEKGICIDAKAPKKIITLACDIFGKDGYILNQTLHKSFNTVVNISDFELYIQQIMHYITTYGYENLGIYKDSEIYIPNEKLEIEGLKEGIKLINIKEITKKELSQEVMNLCTSGVALSKDTLDSISAIIDYIDVTNEDIKRIKNKEAKIIFYDKLNIIPEKPEEFFRYLIYVLTEGTLVIKSKELYKKLKDSDKAKAINLLTKYDREYGLNRLAEIYNRYKPLFLSLKITKNVINEDKNRIKEYIEKYPYNKKYFCDVLNRKITKKEIKLNSIINKISHLSKKYHKPMPINELDSFVIWCMENENKKDFNKILEEKIKKAGIWRAIKLINYLKYRKFNSSIKVYKIRNGKTWVHIKENKLKYNVDNVIDILDKIIVNKMKTNVKGKKIYLDNRFDFALPQSEKQFVNNIPFGSTLTLDKDNIIFGIHWFNLENNRVDLDLKAISEEYIIGWNTCYKLDSKIIFSGDMTSAPLPNGASEYIYIDKDIGKTAISMKINNYTCQTGDVDYDIIVAKGKKEKIQKDAIIDPNDIILKIPKNKMLYGMIEHTIGNIIIDDKIKLIFTDLTTSSNIVSKENSIEKWLREYIEKEAKSKCRLKEYLEKAGAVLVHQEELAEINLSIENINRNTILDMFK